MPQFARVLAEANPAAAALIEFGKGKGGDGWQERRMGWAEVGVVDVACIGVPNAEMGEELRALVPVDPSDGLPDLDDMAAWLRDRLSRDKCPRTYELVAELPRTTMGKINKRRLRDAYLAGELTGLEVSGEPLAATTQKGSS